MKDGYADKSQSEGKWQARRFAYSHLTPAQKARYHLVIVGWIKGKEFQCDDVPYLISIGIPAKRIIACGIGNELVLTKNGRYSYLSAAEWAADKYGVIACPEPMIKNAVSWAIENDKPLGSVNVDLCDTLITTMRILKSIVSAAKNKCLILFTHRNGRDKKIIISKHDTREIKESRRLNEIKRHIGRVPDYRKPYNSGTDSSPGAAMCVNVFCRQYLCGSCHQMGPHPSQHGKVCSAA